MYCILFMHCNYFGYVTRRDIAWSYGNTILIFWGILYLFAELAWHFILLQKYSKVPISVQPQKHVILLLNHNHTSCQWRDMIFHCSFDLHFLVSFSMMLIIFSCLCWPFVLLLWKNETFGHFVRYFLSYFLYLISTTYKFLKLSIYKIYGFAARLSGSCL
jgi:hypothetical protein